MKEINTTTTEQALAMYTETVSPSEENLRAILSHIPEKKKQEGHMWLDEILGKTKVSTEVYSLYSEEETRSFDNEVRQTRMSEGRAIRSPYMWLEITELVMLCSIMLVVLPSLSKIKADPFYQIDKEVQLFERGVQIQDYQDSLMAPTL